MTLENKTPEADETVAFENDRRSGENAYQRTIYDVPVTATVSIGQKQMTISELLELTADTVIPLSASIEDPVDLTIENRVIARGELIEMDQGLLALKLTEIGELNDD